MVAAGSLVLRRQRRLNPRKDIMVINRIRRRTFAVACAAILVALGNAAVDGATATADTSTAEAMFFDEISLNNATLPGKSATEMITAGYATCDHLRAGVSVLDEISSVERVYRFSQGTLFVSAATTNLCPEFAS
ncbi:DUF732 domain-containing protein [Nocardia sp. R7R-8]|uniref:DUF732 domain-containing protein n=1 Tax=Nocardia sp. R7R-8 TaxID=3459304 RepID=UPI00403DB4EE